mmetsp:Transcript_126327/g.299922  ORF Transcript_126327/g.299922 Transcript_126327/m.299922 type:complete len:217 (-) Transcript_126327:1195-1845(-)
MARPLRLFLKACPITSALVIPQPRNRVGPRSSLLHCVGLRLGLRPMLATVSRAHLLGTLRLDLLPAFDDPLFQLLLLGQKLLLRFAQILVRTADLLHVCFQLGEHAVHVRWNRRLHVHRLRLEGDLLLAELLDLIVHPPLFLFSLGDFLLRPLRLFFLLLQHRLGLCDTVPGLLLQGLGLGGLRAELLDLGLHFRLLLSKGGDNLLELLQASLLIL